MYSKQILNTTDSSFRRSLHNNWTGLTYQPTTAMCVIIRLLFNVCYLLETKYRLGFVWAESSERAGMANGVAFSRSYISIYVAHSALTVYSLLVPFHPVIPSRAVFTGGKIKLFEYHCACNIAVFVYLHLSCCSLFLSCTLFSLLRALLQFQHFSSVY